MLTSENLGIDNVDVDHELAQITNELFVLEPFNRICSQKSLLKHYT